ncbi:MAG: protein-L-isoaspartate(D-aspartate) O-methyltransferase [Gammaproteobacteria bacterium]
MIDSHDVHFSTLRQAMVEQIAFHASLVSAETGKSELADRVMAVMGAVPRHEFVPDELRAFAYMDNPLPIGFGKTISQPFIVALMTDLLEVTPDDRVLEIGTGLGYQAAILSKLARTVYTVEIIGELAREAAARLRKQDCTNVEHRIGDGSHGWPAQAPFDKVIVTAAPELIPTALLHQLSAGGRMVIPAGVEEAQQLMLVRKDGEGLTSTQEILRVRFSKLVTPH